MKPLNYQVHGGSSDLSHKRETLALFGFEKQETLRFRSRLRSRYVKFNEQDDRLALQSGEKGRRDRVLAP